MFDIMLGLLAKARPAISSVIDCREATYRDLSILEVRYVQGNSYYAAKSYSTGTWIAKTPIGPTLKEDGTMKMDTIQDIAEISVYATAAELRHRRWPDRNDLVQVQKALDDAALELVRMNYPLLHDMLHKATFSFSPSPTIQVCLTAGTRFKQMLGTIAIDVSGRIYVASKTTPVVDDFADAMRSVGRLPVPKELGYE